MTIRMSWKRQPRDTGLAGVAQGWRGWDLNVGKANVGYVRARRGLVRSQPSEFYWVARCDKPNVPLMNSAASSAILAQTPAAAVAELEAYVKLHLPDATFNRSALTRAGAVELPLGRIAAYRKDTT